MDLRHLRAFVAVAEESSFTRAARRLHITQPPLSRHVRQLEDELGVTLFVRHRDGIELTSQGRILLDKARGASAAIADFQSAAESMKTPHAGVVRLGIGWGLWDAVDRIRAHYVKQCSDVLISAVDLCTGPERPRVEDLDVVVARAPIDDAAFESERLFDEQFVAIVSAAHAVAARKSVRLEDLASEPLLMYERGLGPSVYDKTIALYRAAGIRPRIVPAQPPPYTQSAMMLVATRQGYYIGIASPFTQTHRTSGVAIVPLEEPDARIPVCIARRRGASSGSVREFLRSAHVTFARERSTVASSVV